MNHKDTIKELKNNSFFHGAFMAGLIIGIIQGFLPVSKAWGLLTTLCFIPIWYLLGRIMVNKK